MLITLRLIIKNLEQTDIKLFNVADDLC